MSGDVERTVGDAIAKALPGVPVYDSQGRRLGGLDVESMLAGHPQENARPKSHDGDPWKYDGTYVCACGVEYKSAPGIGGAFRGHRAHVAAVLREQIVSVLDAACDENPLELDEWQTYWRNFGLVTAAGIFRDRAAQVAPSRVPGESSCTCNPAEVEGGVCVLCGKPYSVGGSV